MFGYGQESPGKPHIKKSHAYLSCLRTSAYLFPRKSLPCNVSHTKCKQAAAAALDSCFRRSSTSSAFRWRSRSESLMLESVHVWIWPGITRKTAHKKEPCIPVMSAHISIFISSQIYIPRLLPCNVSHTTRNQSASKLQQLPWTAVFEDLQLLLRSADAPGLTP